MIPAEDGVSVLEKPGFITQEDPAELELREKVAVSFPHSYNFSGELFIVSGGMINLKEHRE
jgi:hypothetical protein